MSRNASKTSASSSTSVLRYRSWWSPSRKFRKFATRSARKRNLRPTLTIHSACWESVRVRADVFRRISRYPSCNRKGTRPYVRVAPSVLRNIAFLSEIRKARTQVSNKCVQGRVEKLQRVYKTQGTQRKRYEGFASGSDTSEIVIVVFTQPLYQVMCVVTL